MPRHTAIDVFEAVPDQELRLAGRRRRFSRGEVVFHRDDPGDGVHRVEHGHFAARILTAVGEVATVALYGPGEIFGLLAVVGERHWRTATVSALEAGETLTVSTSSYRELRSSYPEIGIATERLLAAELAETSDWLVQALYMPTTKRVLARLADLARLYAPAGDESEPPASVVIPLSQEHLAGLAGTTRETVNRVLKAESGKGRVALSRNRIEVLDPGWYVG